MSLYCITTLAQVRYKFCIEADSEAEALEILKQQNNPALHCDEEWTEEEVISIYSISAA
jgi:hypothetical protein